MSRRLDIERQKELEPKRMETAVEKLAELGINAIRVDDRELEFEYKGKIVSYFPYSGWATGQSIKDGRGLDNLLNQLKGHKKKDDWRYEVAPKKKKVKIFFRNKLIKTYNFKMDVPSRKVKKEFEGHDYSNWCVSERDYTYTREVIKYDQKVINEIGQKALDHHKKLNQLK